MKREVSAPTSVTITLPNGALGGWWVLIDTFKRAKEETGIHMVFDGLIAQIEAQLPIPKPDEPQGLGAVVEDAEGDRYVRRADSCQPVWVHADGATFPTHWKNLDVVRVLSEGVVM